ncbi:hypothetical protein ACHAPQ_005890 [Fusarium lateritium]
MSVLRSDADYTHTPQEGNSSNQTVGENDVQNGRDEVPQNAPPAPDYEPESFWPNIRKYVLGHTSPNNPPIKGVCPICWDQVSIAGLPRPPDEGKQCLIAPCGHILCYECWPKKFEDDGVTLTDPRKCPMCRLLLECETCGRSCIKEKAPEYSCDVEDVADVPRTVPETDLPYNPTCLECIWPRLEDGFGRLQGGVGWWFKQRRRRRRHVFEII